MGDSLRVSPYHAVVCAPGGGFIMDSAAMIDEAITENIEAMFEATYKYGKR